MDWADDVAYSVHDLEDGLQAGMITLAALRDPAERQVVAELTAAAYVRAGRVGQRGRADVGVRRAAGAAVLAGLVRRRAGRWPG